MPSWSGWEVQFLNAAGLPTATNNQAFLDSWQKNSTSNCGNNPIDVSHKMSGSTNCFSLPGTAGFAQKYASHAQAASAFDSQIHSGSYPNLVAAFKSKNPYTVNDPKAVEAELVKWGSGFFELAYQNAVTLPPTGGGGGNGIPAPRAHKGWADLRHTLNITVHSELSDSRKLTVAALRSLSRVHKVP